MKTGYGIFGCPESQLTRNKTKKAAQILGGIASKRCIERVTNSMERNFRVALYSAVFVINVWVASLLAVTVAQAAVTRATC